MKKIIIVGSVLAASLTMVSCAVMHNTARATTDVVNTGERVVTTTGHAVGSTVKHGVNILTGQTATRQDVATYHKHGVILRDGHTYKIEHGKYVLVR